MNQPGFIVSSSGEGATMQFGYPSTQYSIHDFTAIPIGVNAPNAAGILLLPFMSTKGVDREVKFFESNQLGDFVEHYGDPNLKKFGLSSRAGSTWLAAGGRLAACRLTSDDARIAGAHIELDINTESGGNVVIGTHTITLPNKYTFEAKNVVAVDYDDLGDFELGAKAINSTTNNHYPFLWVASRGRGKYGNDFVVSLDLNESGTATHPDLTREVPTHSLSIVEKSMLKENYKVALQGDVISSALSALSFESVIETNSVNRITAGRIEDIDDVLTDKIYTIFDELYNIINGSSTIIDDINNDTDKVLPITQVYDAVTEIADGLEDGTLSIHSLFDMYNNKVMFGDVDLSALFGTIDFSAWNSIKFGGGQDFLPGENMKSFDWDFNPTGAIVDTPPITKLFNDFFGGVITKDIYNFNKVPADLVIDMDYPTVVKQTITGLCQDNTGKRGDISYFMNAPAFSTVEQLKDWDALAGIYSKSVFAWAETMDTVDTASRRPLKNVPTTYLALAPVAQWFLEGGKSGFAGTTRICPGIVNNTISPVSDDLEGIYTTMRYNCIMTFENGNNTFFGQTAKFKVEGQAVKIPNKLMVNRFKRHIVQATEAHRFTLASDLADIQKAINRDMASFGDIFNTMEITVKWAEGQEADREAQGILDVVCNLRMNAYVENFNIPINLMSSSS